MDSRSSASEIVLTRVYDAPVRAVWDAWTIPEQVEQWWGPRGFTLTTHSKDLRAGGTWRYTMHGPDGVDYPNVTTYLVVEPYRKLVYDHGGNDERAPLFRVTVTFSELNGQTTMEMISSLPSPEAATAMAKFIKQAGGNATWDRLAEHLDEIRTGKRRFVVARTFDAPIAQVFEMWVSPEHLERWLPPAGDRKS
ncbi:MAG: SRPBCC domain-containing protein, partial [Vicinamibacterales bacterium]